jgi:regulator of protease activity HflC (stomatin/prohibitin superfamily)
MLGIRYLKVPATNYVLQFRGGKLKRHGAGLSFWYFAPTSVVALVPITSVDVPFAFVEMSSDFQEVTIQGTLTYRIRDAVKIASLLDYSVEVSQRYQSDDPSKLGERLVQEAQAGARAFIQSQPLRAVLVSSASLVDSVIEALRASETIELLGIDVLSVAIVSLKPDPEMAKALQAQARELLPKQADEAIYEGEEIVVDSLMPAGGVIFSDGVESDFLEFNAGSIARISAAAERACLVVH